MSSTVSDKDMSGPAPQIEPVLKRVNADVKRIDLSPARCFLETSALIIVKIGLLQIDTGPLVMQLTGLILLLAAWLEICAWLMKIGNPGWEEAEPC